MGGSRKMKKTNRTSLQASVQLLPNVDLLTPSSRTSLGGSKATAPSRFNLNCNWTPICVGVG
jgi:hypothetical protein